MENVFINLELPSPDVLDVLDVPYRLEEGSGSGSLTGDDMRLLLLYALSADDGVVCVGD